MSDSPPLHQLTEQEAAFLIKRGLQLLPASILRDLQSGRDDKRQPALKIASDTILAHFGVSGHRIVRGPGLGNHG